VIRIGQVVGAFGVQGAVKVLPLTDFEDRFRPGSRLYLEGAARHVEWSRPGQTPLVVKLAGIDNRTLAEIHRGRYLEIPEEEVRPLPPGSWYDHQLVGLAVETSSGLRLGRLADVLRRPANDVWVARDRTVERLIPAVRDAVLEVDLERGRVVVADWLLESEDA
jgi:16S rRNA processing protein RimM